MGEIHALLHAGCNSNHFQKEVQLSDYRRYSHAAFQTWIWLPCKPLPSWLVWYCRICNHNKAQFSHNPQMLCRSWWLESYQNCKMTKQQGICWGLQKNNLIANKRQQARKKIAKIMVKKKRYPYRMRLKGIFQTCGAWGDPRSVANNINAMNESSIEKNLHCWQQNNTITFSK